jgi:hypothetical protein
MIAGLAQNRIQLSKATHTLEGLDCFFQQEANERHAFIAFSIMLQRYYAWTATFLLGRLLSQLFVQQNNAILPFSNLQCRSFVALGQ